MLFESKNHKVFSAYPIDKYRYNIEVGESCYAVRLVFDEDDEYVVKRCMSFDKAKLACSNFKKKFNTNTNIIKVTRKSDSKYIYESCGSGFGSPDGTFDQKPLGCIDQFTIKPKKHSYKLPDNFEQPDDFTIGASYLAEECVRQNPIIDDDFTIGASYASSDFYEYNKRKYK